MSKFPIVLLLGVLFSFCNQADSASHTDPNEALPKYQIVRYQKDYEFDYKSALIKIHNKYGNVVVKNSSQPTLGVYAVVQEIGEQPAIHDLIVKNKKNQLSLEIRYSRSDLRKHRLKNSQFPIGRVDLVIFAPKGPQIKVGTSIGKIDIKKVQNSVKLKSTSGDINVTSFQDITAKSKSGQIKAFPLATNWDKGINISSDSGNIYAVIPVNASLNLKARSQANVFSQLDNTSEWVETINNYKRSFGKNDKLYQIKSRTGSIYLSPHTKVK